MGTGDRNDHFQLFSSLGAPKNDGGESYRASAHRAGDSPELRQSRSQEDTVATELSWGAQIAVRVMVARGIDSI